MATNTPLRILQQEVPSQMEDNDIEPHGHQENAGPHPSKDSITLVQQKQGSKDKTENKSPTSSAGNNGK